MKKADVITYAKGVAILAIVLFHLIGGYLNVNPLIIKASGFGGAGVHVFFFCSGFGLMYSQLKKPLNFTGFIKKRFLKIYIPYIIIVIISYFIPFISPNLHNRTLALLSHIFLFKMFVPNLENSLGYQFWYISTIIQFYFVFILLVKLFFKLQKKYFMILCCALSFCWAIIVTMLGYTEIRVWNSFFLQYLWEFALGMVIAGYYSESGKLLIDKISTPILCIITVIAFGIYSVLSLKGGLLKSFNDPFSFAAISGICIILYRLKFLQKFIYFTSAISYEIYLIHILVYNTLFTVLKSFLNQYVIAAVSLILIFILSYVYNKFCKKILFK
jgi:peptidoglycan/LPS O-acetylase OafA/YrhL